MGQRIDFETESLVFAFHLERYSVRKIVEKCSNMGKMISKSAVAKIIRRKKAEQIGAPRTEKKLPQQCLPSSRTPALIRKVKKAVYKKNPPTQSCLARMYNVSRRTIKRIFEEDLGIKTRKKKKTHHLTEKQAQQRLDRGPAFLEHLTPRKLRYLFTFDETYISLDDLSGETDFYYEMEGVEIPEDWKLKPRKSWPKQVMVVIGICWRGKSKAYIVPEKAKVNAEYFIHHILKPIVEKDIPRLYGDKSWKVKIHMDSAPGHVAKKTYDWLDSQKIKYITKEEWMGNSPDMSPMDYGINGDLKKIFPESTPMISGNWSAWSSWLGPNMI